MPTSIKLSITCRKPLEAKYDANALSRIDAAVANWVAADKARGIRTIHLALDDATAMKAHKVPAVSGRITASKVKKALDALVIRLEPEYIVLFGATDVVPSFIVANPTRDEDDEPTVPTDNPYASSRKFSSRNRASYLIPDRVVGRIADVANSSDPSWLLDYLAVVTQWEAAALKKYAKALLVCCDTWKKSGRECVRFIARDSRTLMISPPAGEGSRSIRSKHSRLVHMIKCHGGEGDSQFYGQRANSYPPVLRSTSLLRRTKKGTVVGAMCCFGASIFDPQDQANISPGEPPIPSVYLRQGAFGFLGATTTAWVGDETMICADWMVASFLKAVLNGASLGRATLESKQDFVRWIQQQGNDMDSGDEKTLLQFVLLGDPVIHPVKATSPAGLVSASLLGVGSSSGAVMARRARRAIRHELGAILRADIPRVTPVRSAAIPANIRALARVLAKPPRGRRTVRLSPPRVDRVVRTIARPASGPLQAGGGAPAGRVVERENRQYYWATAREGGPVRHIRMVSIQADPQGNVLRAQVLVSS